ncbi:M3 family metallopeptidase [Aliikangiella coralliicola]|uniref:M3 family metallopeptidase n=1 Tax=Aliikangiella coralliicola TaxID=2592383 RepID=A0A545UGH4_9GAMM|nr:M3 family metallopeptidase [Aliikangiella coralliicola]TQV88569.1 M3 family metallopeptidase [Aliikangiella coralliicola]
MNRKHILGVAIALAISACSQQDDSTNKTAIDKSTTNKVEDIQGKGSAANSLLVKWETPYKIPPFERISDSDYMPAFNQAVKSMRNEIDAITNNPEEPTFENTIVALETAGSEMTRIIRVFSNITGTDTNDKLRALQVEIYPKLTREQDAITLNQKLFERVAAVYNKRNSLNLDQQDARLLELTHLGFIRSGASLDEKSKARLKEINAEISKVTTNFAQNLLAETKNFELVVTDEKKLAGLSDGMINAAKSKAESKGKKGAWVFGLDRATYEGFMTYSENRELRKVMFDGYRARGANGNEADNRELILKIAKLRAERAKLLGYDSHAHYQLETRMAKTPKNAEDFLLKVWKPGLARAEQEKAEMQTIINEEGKRFELAGHDWWHYAEKLRAKKYAFDESQVKPYFELSNVINGAFHVAGKLFGLTFTELKDTPKWHSKVRVYDVKDENGEHLGVFMADFYSRDSKRGGAWMSSFRQASSVDDKVVRPIITNNLNITPPAEGDPTLLSFDQVNTLFHEFGHGLHGLMTLARYERYAGTSGSPRDFTEFPAQFLEHYASAPEVLPIYAKHYQTGEVIPAELLAKLQAASTHNQGFKTTEFIAASLLDLAWHRLSEEELSKISDAEVFETKTLSDYGLLKEIGPRYRSNYFAHIFSSPSGYSAGYYAYLWSEILDADGFTAFRESGNIYDKTLALRLAQNVYQAGGREPADELYRKFRLKDPTIKPLLKIRGLD